MMTRILHIEDDDGVWRTFRETMDRYNAEITQFESIFAANKFNGAVDLILLDCQPLSSSKDGLGRRLASFLDRFHGADIFLYCGLPYLIRDLANEIGDTLGRGIPFGGLKEAIECAKEKCELKPMTDSETRGWKRDEYGGWMKEIDGVQYLLRKQYGCLVSGYSVYAGNERIHSFRPRVGAFITTISDAKRAAHKHARERKV